jgi:lipid-A-disaccharide synthase-like uncharacterized protein
MDIAKLNEWWAAVSGVETTWVAFGLAAQSMFFMRFLVQWVASERVKRSVVPETFWYFSLAGGLMLLLYGVHRADPVIMLGQLAGLFVYARNISLIWSQKRLEDPPVRLGAAAE